MYIYYDIVFLKLIDFDLKRENVNVNGDILMGVMLKYGSEGVKEFNRMFVLNFRYFRVYDEGIIYIYDLDFLILIFICC